MKRLLNEYRSKNIKYTYDLYKKELEKCYARMMCATEGGYTFCTYVVPLEKDLFTTWNHIECITYMYDEFKAEGIVVLVSSPNILHLSWKNVDDELVKKNKNEKIKKYLGEINKLKDLKKKYNI